MGLKSKISLAVLCALLSSCRSKAPVFPQVLPPMIEKYEPPADREVTAIEQQKPPTPELPAHCSGASDSRGKRVGTWTCIFTNGVKQSVLHYKRGKRDGNVDFWSSDGTPSFTSEWKDGWLDGKMVHYFDATHKKLESHFKRGHLEGLSREWDPNGTLRVETEYKDGLMDGTVREYYPDGHRKSEAHYTKEELDGDFVEWWDNGNVRATGRFKAGKKDGEWKYFDQDASPAANEPSTTSSP